MGAIIFCPYRFKEGWNITCTIVHCTYQKITIHVCTRYQCKKLRYLHVNWVKVTNCLIERLVVGKGYFVFAIIHNIFSGVDLSLDIPFPLKSAWNDLQIMSSIVPLPGCEECNIQVARIMIDSASSTVTSCNLDTFIIESTQVSFLPRILVSSNHYTRVIPPQ